MVQISLSNKTGPNTYHWKEMEQSTEVPPPPNNYSDSSSSSDDGDSSVLVRYFFSVGADGEQIEQADRNFVAQAIEYYSGRKKSDPCPAQPILSDDIQGVTTNRDADNPVRTIFLTLKHLNAMCCFIQQSRAQHHNFIVHVSVDGSPYLQIL